MIKDPKPGSKEAIEAGCNCPVIDNHHGAGVPLKHPGTSDMAIGYWMTADCVIHGVKDAAQED